MNASGVASLRDGRSGETRGRRSYDIPHYSTLASIESAQRPSSTSDFDTPREEKSDTLATLQMRLDGTVPGQNALPVHPRFVCLGDPWS